MSKGKNSAAYHSKKFETDKTKAHSHHNGWLSGLKRSLIRGTISKLDYDESVSAYRRNRRKKYQKFSYRVAT